MADPLFSEREGFAPKMGVQTDDYLPGWVREAIKNEITDLAEKTAMVSIIAYKLNLYPIFRPYIWKVMGVKPPGSPQGGPYAYYIPKVLEQCPWYMFYDALEEVANAIKLQLGEEYFAKFLERINSLLGKEGIAWQYDIRGKFERTLHPSIKKLIEQAQFVISDPRFQGPDLQLQKAISHLNKRPEPDEENCIKDSVGALEGVANFIAGTTGAQLNQLIDIEPFRSRLPATIRESIKKVYAYRGNAPGASHALLGEPVVDLSDAKWVLAISTATILYLVEKFQGA